MNLSTLSIDTTPPLFLDLLALPRSLALVIFARLPVDTRMRCSEVSRAWRALLADTSLWRHLNVSTSSGCTHFSEALFRAAIAKAGGQLRVLDVNGRGGELTIPTLLEALASNAATLEVLDARFPTPTPVDEVQDILEAAPFALCQLRIVADAEQARRYVCNEPPYDRLLLHTLIVTGAGQLDSLESLEAFCSDLIEHPCLKSVIIHQASLGTAAAMRLLVSAAIALRLPGLGFVRCGCTRACVPELTRLVSAGEVIALVLHNYDVELFEAGADTDQFCAAVRASTSLTRLDFDHCGPNPDAAAVAAFINARHQ